MKSLLWICVTLLLFAAAVQAQQRVPAQLYPCHGTVGAAAALCALLCLHHPVPDEPAYKPREPQTG